jgi:hypothetical protein
MKKVDECDKGLIPWVTGSLTLAPQANNIRMSSSGAQRINESANSLCNVCKHGKEGIITYFVFLFFDLFSTNSKSND